MAKKIPNEIPVVIDIEDLCEEALDELSNGAGEEEDVDGILEQ